MRKLLILLLLATAQYAGAQNEGTLRLYLSPPAEAVAIDGEVLEFGNTSQLKPGKYFLQAWCPDKALLDTIIEIKAGETVNFFYRFENSPDYNQHLAAMKDYNKKKTAHFFVPLFTTTAIAGIITYTYFKGKQLEQQTEDKYLAYKYAGFNVNAQEADWKESRDKYKNYYYAQFVEYAAFAVSSYFLYKGIKWLKNNPKPEKEADKNPFKIDQVGLAPNEYGGYGVGMRISLD